MSKRRRRAFRGQALVEFALILPILILLLVGVFDARTRRVRLQHGQQCRP